MFKKFILASVILTASSIASQANVLFSDDFESNALGLNTTPNGWVIDLGSVDTIGTGFYDFYGPGRYIDTNGSTGEAGIFHTAQSFNLMAGNTYTISFDYGYNKNLDNDPTHPLKGLIFGFFAGNSLVTSNGSIANFLHEVFTFTASANSIEQLQFLAFGSDPGDNGGIILDNVSLSVVPVPAALPLFAAGLGVLGFAGRRRRAKSAA